MAIYGKDCYFELVDNSIEKYYYGVYFNGHYGNSYKTLKLSSGNISDCNTGVYTQFTNAFIKYCANINNNDIGIYSVAQNAQQQKILTVGRDGGAVIKDNTFGIRGENIIIEIDAIAAISNNDGVHHPNDLSGNQVFFDLTYPGADPDPNTGQIPTSLLAKGNYWGWYNGCGGNIDDFSPTTNIPGFPTSYAVPVQMNINDGSKLDYPPVDCLHSGQICGGATAPGNNGNTAPVNTNFNLIYNIANDYMEEESYNNALFGFSLLAGVEDKPVYNSLSQSDKSTVVFSIVYQENLLEVVNELDMDQCRGGDPSLLFPDLEITDKPTKDIKLIKTISPNPFKDVIQLVTSIEGTYVIEIFLANNLNGRALRYFKSENPEYKIDGSILKPGVYILKVRDEKGNSDFVEILKTY